MGLRAGAASGGSGFASWRCSVARSGGRSGCAHPAGRRRPGIRGDQGPSMRLNFHDSTRRKLVKDEYCVNSKCDSGQVCRLN
jgi:hypothetical protein